MGSGLCKLVHDPVAGEGDSPPNPNPETTGRTKDDKSEKPLTKYYSVRTRPKLKYKIPPEPGLPVACIAHTPKKSVYKHKRRNSSKYPRSQSLSPSGSQSPETSNPRKEPMVYCMYDAATRQAKLSMRKSQPYWIKTKLKDYIADATIQAKAKQAEKNRTQKLLSHNVEPSSLEPKMKTPLYAAESSTPKDEFESVVAIAIGTARQNKLTSAAVPENAESSRHKAEVAAEPKADAPQASDHGFQKELSIIPVSI